MQSRYEIQLLATLDSDGLTPEMYNGLALVAAIGLIFLLERLRDDVLHVRMNESLELMQSVSVQPSHTMIVVLPLISPRAFPFFGRRPW